MSSYKVQAFSSAVEWRSWLARHHARSSGVWVRIYKKASRKKTVTYAEALDEALCFGWIDSQMRSYDARSYIQKFTPRGPKSIWSKVNIGHVARLAKARKLQPAGIAQVKAAKKDGRWARAYDPGSTMKVPEDFLKELKKDAKAYEFFKTLNKANIYGIAWRLQTAKKPETRARRMETLLAMLSQQKKLH